MATLAYAVVKKSDMQGRSPDDNISLFGEAERRSPA
jgi:hypothetical protein